MPEPRPEDVLQFWFGAPGDPPLRNSEKWYKQSDELDGEIRGRFGAAIDAAVRGDLADWRKTTRGRMALVVLLDQFSRNAHRDTSRAFAQDPLARDVALEAITLGDERVLTPVERSFLYMPLMHSEDVDLQHRCVAAFTRLLSDSPADLKAYVASGLDYAKRHEEIVARFGRFPHRNKILGRPSTKEEETFLQQPNSSF